MLPFPGEAGGYGRTKRASIGRGGGPFWPILAEFWPVENAKTPAFPASNDDPAGQNSGTFGQKNVV